MACTPSCATHSRVPVVARHSGPHNVQAHRACRATCAAASSLRPASRICSACGLGVAGPAHMCSSNRRQLQCCAKRKGDKLDAELAEAGGTQAEGSMVARQGVPKGDYWFKLADASELEEKGRKYKKSKAGKELMLWLVNEEIYCSDAHSTAYEFPLLDGKVTVDSQSGRPVVEVPFDGTTYDLRDGSVIKWCPKNNPLRVVLGTFKSKEQAKALPMHDCVRTDDGEVYVKLA